MYTGDLQEDKESGSPLLRAINAGRPDCLLTLLRSHGARVMQISSIRLGSPAFHSTPGTDADDWGAIRLSYTSRSLSSGSMSLLRSVSDTALMLYHGAITQVVHASNVSVLGSTIVDTANVIFDQGFASRLPCDNL